MKITRIIKLLVHWSLASIRAFFFATTSTAWGIGGLFLLANLLITLKGNVPATISPLITLGGYIMKYVMWFWGAAFIYELWTTPHLESDKKKEDKNGER